MPALDFDSLPPRWQTAWRWAAPGLTLAALALLAWNCAFNPNVRCLTPGPGQWIVYPLPPVGHPFSGFELAGTFRRAFVLPEKPAAARLSWRCFTNGEVTVNNTLIPPSGAASANWKTTTRADIAPFLRPGTNEISVKVMNFLGPPALSLELQSGNFRLASDETWQVSVSGSDWRAARAAPATPRPGKGNELALLETTGGALRRCWPWLCLFAGLAIAGAALRQWRLGGATASGPAAPFPKMTLVLLASVWALLFLHNFPLVPAASGFDAPQHLEYVSWLQDHQRRQDPWQAWEMVQPPLYYIICARFLALARCQAFAPSGMLALRFLGLAIGAANVALVFAGLRLVFPGDWRKPLAGLVLAAFLPAQLCLLHYTTNEILSAMFVTAALCVALLLLRPGQPAWGWYGLLGIVLGLALLSKASAVLAMPVILGVLALKLALRRERSAQAWLAALGLPLLICLALSAWHYVELWRQYGNPLTGGWDPKVVAPWWQTKGFQTPGYYFSFGDAFTRPFFSGLRSFWDAFYTTLWGDGLLGGKIDVWGRPPWNYDLMAAGFLLALAPTALVLTGLARALARCLRAADLGWLLLLGCGWLFAFAIVAMSLKAPSYSHTKAFFALPALLPFCALGALGFDFWAGRGRVARHILAVALGFWLINLYASFWIRPRAERTELASAIAASVYLKADPTEAFLKVLNHYPGNSQAALWLASIEAQKHPEQAVKRLEQALRRDPAGAWIEFSLARDLAACGRLDEALVHAQHALELAPEDEGIAQGCCLLELRRKNHPAAVAAGRYALGLNPTDLGTHFNLGLALMNLRQIPEAISHFSAVADANPAWADAQFCLGLCLLDQPGGRDEGLNHLRQAVRLNPANTAWQAALQNALQIH